ncbi:DUF6254 family protein [Virgibacillus necropolis]
MAKPKQEQEREWRDRKESQNPHGKVKSFEQLANDAKKVEKK